MPRKSATLTNVENIIDDASEYLTARSANWEGDTSPVVENFQPKSMGRRYKLKDVEAQANEENGILASHLHLEAFAANGWNKKDTVVAFGSYVNHLDRGELVAVLIGGKPTSMTLEPRNSSWGKLALVLFVTE